ncbi:MAG TPA: LysM peptidoglycan-binding domain-containing protein [Capillibacterium sp.]
MSEKVENTVETAQAPETTQLTCPPGGILYTVRAGDTLFSIANRFGISVECLRRFNPQVVGDQIFPGQVLCVPPASACGTTPTCPPGGILYTVRAGDTLSEIANRFGVTVNCILQFNPQITNPNVITPGQVICIPPASACVPTPSCPTGGFFYTVRAGDSLFSIANQFGISIECLRRFNPQVVGDQIFPGQILCIPPASACVPTPTCPPGGILYTVRAGDTMFNIANRFGISLECLRRFNPQVVGDQIFPGQILCIPPASACATTPTCPPGGILYTVRAGDTMFNIANRFGIPLDCLIRFNPQITNPNLIFPGQVLCVPPASACVGQTQCPPGGILYTVRAGDTMFNIANRFGIPLNCLIRFNPQIPNPNQINPGQVLCVPPSSACN